MLFSMRWIKILLAASKTLMCGSEVSCLHHLRFCLQCIMLMGLKLITSIHSLHKLMLILT